MSYRIVSYRTASFKTGFGDLIDSWSNSGLELTNERGGGRGRGVCLVSGCSHALQVCLTPQGDRVGVRDRVMVVSK